MITHQVIIHHQDVYIFSKGSQAKPLFSTITGKGDNPNDNWLLTTSISNICLLTHLGCIKKSRAEKYEILTSRIKEICSTWRIIPVDVSG